MNCEIEQCVRVLKSCCTNQSCCVKWDNKQSDYFKISNGVKQGGVISPLLFSCYIDKLFTQLQHSGLGRHICSSYAGAFGYADDIALLAPSLQCFKQMISICEKYASSHSITFNPNKSILLCDNADLASNVPQVYLNLIRSGLFQTSNDPGGGGFKSPSPPPTISKTVVSIFTISYMCILPGVLGMFQLEFFKNSRF